MSFAQSPQRQFVQSPARQRIRSGATRFRILIATKLPYGHAPFSYSGTGPITIQGGFGMTPLGVPFRNKDQKAYQLFEYIGKWNGNIFNHTQQVCDWLSGQITQTVLIRNTANDPGPRYPDDIFTELVTQPDNYVVQRSNPVVGGVLLEEYRLTTPKSWDDLIATLDGLLVLARSHATQYWHDIYPNNTQSTNFSSLAALSAAYEPFYGDPNPGIPAGSLVISAPPSGSNAALLNALPHPFWPYPLTGATVKQVVDFEGVGQMASLFYGSTSRQVPLPTTYSGIILPVRGATLTGGTFTLESDVYQSGSPYYPGFKSWQVGVTCASQTVFSAGWVQCS